MAEYSSVSNPYRRRLNGKHKGKPCSISLQRFLWIKYYGPIPEGYVVHHINGNKEDNRIENLACISYSEHSKIHWEERKKRELKFSKCNTENKCL